MGQQAKAKKCQRRITRRQIKLARKVDKITRLAARLEEMKKERVDILKSQDNEKDEDKTAKKDLPPPHYAEQPPAYEPPTYENVCISPPSYDEAQQQLLY